MTNNKFSIFLVTLSFVFIALSNAEEHLSDEITRPVWKYCAEKTGATEADVLAYEKEQPPANNNAVCLGICFLQKLKAYVKEQEKEAIAKTDSIAQLYKCGAY